MTDKGLVSIVSLLMGKADSEINDAVMALLEIGLADIYSLVPGFWTKVSEEFTLGTSGSDAYLVNLKEEFPDFWQLRFMWTATGPIDFMTEKRFRIRHPNPGDTTGTPIVYFFREKSLVELWPHNSESQTIYVAYRYRPQLKSIGDLPEEWHFVPFYFIMGFFEGKDSNFYKVKYDQALKRMQEFARESEEEFAEIIGDGADEAIYAEREDLR